MHGFVNIKPMIKGRPRFGKGFAYTPKRTRDYEKILKLNIMELMRSENNLALTGPVHITINFRMLKPKKASNPYPSGDLDNYVKAFLDAANEILFVDDKQITLLTASKCYVTDPLEEGILFRIRSE